MPLSQQSVVLITLGSLAGLTVLFALIGASFSVLDWQSWGLQYNLNTRTLDGSTVYQGGRYFLGVGQTFVVLPRILSTLQFTGSSQVAARTSEGMELVLETSLQYQLDPANLYNLVTILGPSYENVYRSVVLSSIQDVASNYTGLSFFTSRQQIAQRMHRAVNASLASLYASVPYFQLRNIDLPDEFENAVTATEVARQDINTATYQQQSALVQAATDLYRAEANARIALTRANSTAQALALSVAAEASALNITSRAEATAYAQLATRLGFTPDELIAYLWVSALEALTNARMVVGLNQGTLLNLST